MGLLSNVERDFLTSNRQFTKQEESCIRYRLNKKLREFSCTDLVLLQDKRFLPMSAASKISYAAATASLRDIIG